MENQICQGCGRPLTGRIDKKYCNDQCRATYHNQNKRQHERMIRAVNQQLRKNRTILKRFCPDGKATVRKSRLIEQGFAFQYFSSIYQSNKLTYYFSYEYGFAPITETAKSDGHPVQKVLIIQSQDHMKGAFDPSWRASVTRAPFCLLLSVRKCLISRQVYLAEGDRRRACLAGKAGSMPPADKQNDTFFVYCLLLFAYCLLPVPSAQRCIEHHLCICAKDT